MSAANQEHIVPLCGAHNILCFCQLLVPNYHVMHNYGKLNKCLKKGRCV